MTTRRQKLAEIAFSALDKGARVVIFPESVSGSNRRSQTPLWQNVAEKAASQNATVLVGEEYWLQNAPSFLNALVGYGTGVAAGNIVAASQVPMPVGDWKFGLDDGAQVDIFGYDMVILQGKNVAFSICYEDFLFWTHRGLLSGKADVLVSAANQWPSRDISAEVAQDVARAALARLAGTPLLTTKNR